MLLNVFMVFIILSCNSLVYFLNKNDVIYYKKRDSENIIIPREIVIDKEVEVIIKKYLKSLKIYYILTSVIILLTIPLSTEINLAIIFWVLNIYFVLFF